LILKNIILLNIDYLLSSANLSCALGSFHESIDQAKRHVANIHSLVFSPLNISLPALILLQVRHTKITNKVLGLNLENRLSLNQTFLSASKDSKK
jgi:hypothetical protein